MSLTVSFTALLGTVFLFYEAESAVTAFGSLKPLNPSFVKERDNIGLKWSYTINGSIGSVKFSNVTDGSSTIIASKFGAGDVNVGASFRERFTVDVSNTLTQVTILTVQRSDHGSYEFEIIVAPDNVVLKDTVELIVQLPVKLTNVSDDLTVPEGSNTTLVCEATGRPKPNITLTRVLKDGNKYDEVLPQGPTWNFTNIKRTASGTYRCTAENDFENVSQVFKVNVTYPAKIVKLVSEHELASQQSIPLDCQAEGNPLPTYTWTPCDPPQSACHESVLIFQASNKSVYTFTCKVVNYLGSDTRNTTLFIASDVINVTLVITIEKCTDGEYNQLWEKLSKMIDDIFAGKLGYESVQRKTIRCGSVIVDLALKFRSTVRESEVLSILRDAANNGSFGDFNVSAIRGTRYDTGIKTTMATTPTSSPDSTTWIIVGVVLGLVGVVVVGVVAVCVYKKWKGKKTGTREVHNRSQEQAGGNGQDDYVQVNRGYAGGTKRHSGGANTSSGPPVLYDTAQTGNRGAVKEQPVAQYAVVDKSKKKPKKPKPGELQYAELGEFSTGQGGPRSSTFPTNRPTETQYADVNAM